jgi:CheY-like chemotaxis protein
VLSFNSTLWPTLGSPRILRNIIECNGWVVCGEAADGRDAIEKAKAQCPDLIVLILSMRVMNGLEAARVLHQIMPGVPMILCSLHANEVLQREASAAGVKMLVSKSENMQILITKAKELLETTAVSNPET